MEVRESTSSNPIKKAASAVTSTIDRAVDFALDAVNFDRAEETNDTDRPEVKPGDLPSSFEVGDLDYYLEREADFEARHPDLEPPDYYTQYGDRYINEFAELSPDLSEQGQEWVTETRENLQQAFEDRIADDPEAFDRLEQDEEALRDFAFDSHSNAYLDAGFANLPPEDILQIATTPTFEDFFSSLAIREAVEVGVQAAVENPSIVAEVPAQALEELNSYISDNVIEVTDEVAEKFGGLANSSLDEAGDLIETAGDFLGNIPGPLGSIFENGGDGADIALDTAGDVLDVGSNFLADRFGDFFGFSTAGQNVIIDATGGFIGDQLEAPVHFIDEHIVDLDRPAEVAGEVLGQGVEIAGDIGGEVLDTGGDLLDAGGDLLGAAGGLFGF